MKYLMLILVSLFLTHCETWIGDSIENRDLENYPITATELRKKTEDSIRQEIQRKQSETIKNYRSFIDRLFREVYAVAKLGGFEYYIFECMLQDDNVSEKAMNNIIVPYFKRIGYKFLECDPKLVEKEDLEWCGKCYRIRWGRDDQ